jgi:hypothetical protein
MSGSDRRLAGSVMAASGAGIQGCCMRTPHHLQLALLALASTLTLGADGCRKDDEEDDDGAGESESDDDAADDDDDDADPSAGDDADPSAGDDADPSAGDDAADDAATDDGSDGSSTSAADEGPGGDHSIAGTVGRSEAAVPFMGNDAIGDVYVVAFADACSSGMPVANGMVAAADLSDPATAVPFTLEGLAPGTYFLTGFLDDNLDYDPADPGPNMGDIVMADGAMAGCAEVEIVDADAEGVALVLTLALPFDTP